MAINMRRCYYIALFAGICAFGAGCYIFYANTDNAYDITRDVIHWQHADYFEEAEGDYEAPNNVPTQFTAHLPWSAIALPHTRLHSVLTWNNLPPKAEINWYRLEVPLAWQLRQWRDASRLHLYIPRWQAVGTLGIYVNGQRIYRSQGSRVWTAFNHPLWLPLNDLPNTSKPAEILIRTATPPGNGGALSSVWIGTDQALQWRYRWRHWMQVEMIKLTSWAFSLIGLFALMVWFYRRKEPIYGLFFLTSLAYLLRSLTFTVGDLHPILPDAWFGWAVVNVLPWSIAGVSSFMACVNASRSGWLNKFIFGLCTALSLLTLPVLIPQAVEMAVFPWIYTISALLALVVAFVGTRDAWKARSREGLVLGLGFTLTVFLGLHDLMMAQGKINIESLYLAPYNAIIIFVVFLVITLHRYVNAISFVEQANVILENRLAEREKALSDTYQQLRGLERQTTINAERKRMTQNMHDGIGSSLMSALRMVERGKLNTEKLAQVLQECIDDLKLSIDSLEVAEPDLLALLASLRFRLGSRLEAAGVVLHWNVNDVPLLPWLEAQNALHILRILQEILTNIIKHSPATQITLSTLFDHEYVLVKISDNSSTPFELTPPPPSMPPTTSTNGGQGISNVVTRCQAISARCVWTTTPEGNQFMLYLPRVVGEKSLCEPISTP